MNKIMSQVSYIHNGCIYVFISHRLFANFRTLFTNYFSIKFYYKDILSPRFSIVEHVLSTLLFYSTVFEKYLFMKIQNTQKRNLDDMKYANKFRINRFNTKEKKQFF